MPYGKGTYGSKVGRPKKKSPAAKKAAAKKTIKTARKSLRDARAENRAARKAKRKSATQARRTKRISASITRQEAKKKDPRNAGPINQANKKARLKRLNARLKRAKK